MFGYKNLCHKKNVLFYGTSRINFNGQIESMFSKSQSTILYVVFDYHQDSFGSTSMNEVSMIFFQISDSVWNIIASLSRIIWPPILSFQKNFMVLRLQV